MFKSRRPSVPGLLPLALVLLAIPGFAEDEAEAFREVFNARAVAMGTTNPPVLPPGRSAGLQINITRWTTPEERNALLTTLKQDGQAAVVRALQNQEGTGWLRVTSPARNPMASASSMQSRGSSSRRGGTTVQQRSDRAVREALARATGTGERLRYAWQVEKEDGGRRVVLALDRPIAMWESSTLTRWRQHDITLLVLELDAEDDGKGQLALGVQVSFDEETNDLTIQSFGTEPVRLTSVRRSR